MSDRKTRVLWLCSPLLPRYGVMTIIRGWASAIDYARFDVTLAYDSPDPVEVPRRLAEFMPLKVVHVPELASLRSFYVPAIGRLTRLMREGRFDVVHTVFVQADILGAFAAGRAGVPAVVSSVMGYLVVPRGNEALKTAIYKSAYRVASRRIDRVMAITKTTGEQLVDEFGVPRERVRVVYSGVPQTRHPRPAHAANEPTIGAAGQLIPEKGMATFVSALPLVLERLPSARFLIAGDGPERASLEALAVRLGVAGRLEFLGFREDIPQIMATLDAFAFSSFPKYDGLPRVILEAMVQGTPVVAARTTPIEEIVRDGVTGWLFEPGDARGLADGLVKAVSEPGREAIAARGQQQASEINIEREVAAITRTYEEVLQQSAVACAS
jgi:glycosyltransferase involved in cell wall biosynthesis